MFLGSCGWQIGFRPAPNSRLSIVAPSGEKFCSCKYFSSQNCWQMNISIVCTLTPEDDEHLYWQWAQNVQKSAEILKIAMNSSFKTYTNNFLKWDEKATKTWVNGQSITSIKPHMYVCVFFLNFFLQNTWWEIRR